MMSTQYAGFKFDKRKVLTRNQLVAIFKYLNEEKNNEKLLTVAKNNVFLNLIIFRLACCCGMRASEICKIRLNDIFLDTEKPYLRIRKDMAKGHVYREVQLWWDAATLADISEWKVKRLADGASPKDLFIVSQERRSFGKPLSRHQARRRFLTVVRRCLGVERASTTTIHGGRHSFCTHALLNGKSLPDVRDAAGHSNVAVTCGYLHALDNFSGVENIFNFG